MRPRFSATEGFTLIELLVAMAIGTLLLVSLLSVLSGSLIISRKANESQVGANAASAALDLISTDLESLIATPSSEYLHSVSETVGDHSAQAAKFILLTSSPNDISSTAENSGQVRAVVYRLGFADVIKESGTNRIYGVYRLAETNSKQVFDDYLGKPDLSATTLFSQPLEAKDFVAGNIVDLQIRFFSHEDMSKAINTNSSDTVRLSTTNVSVGGSTINTNVSAAEVSLTYLEETGAKLLQSGAMTLDAVKQRYG
jgi:prepilin-type N-terminal cleavage/methylation domain-containing protein